MRRFALLIILFAGCSTSIGDSAPNVADARPIDFRETPDEKEGTGTAPGCDGVTARGECQQGTAVYCDLERGRKRTVDCAALSQDCILDIGRGAVCKSLEEDTGTGSGVDSPCQDTGVSETGFCSAEGTAVYCDTTGTEPVTRIWDCGSVNKTCAVGQEGCAAGAFCCGGEDDPPPVTNDCGAIDFNGTCNGDTVSWCSPTQGLKTKDCAAENKRCEEDTCITGAWCCGATAEATPEQIMCAELGFAGACNADNTVASYCSFTDEIVNTTCTGTKVCEVDTCGFGAACCEPVVPEVNECTMIGWAGICVNNDTTVRFCAGTEVADILEFDCTDGKTCQVDDTGDANCREVVDPCENLDIYGVCDGDTLQYCIGDTFYDSDCTATGKTCQPGVGENGYANCVE